MNDARRLVRIAIAVGVLLVAGAVLEWAPSEPAPWRWLPLLLAYFIGMGRIAAEAWAALRQGRLSIDFLMGAAAVGAAAIGAPLEGATLIFLFSLSNALEAHALGRTRDAVRGLLRLRPTEAMLADAGGVEQGRVPVSELRIGDHIRVRPGERIAADGIVAAGTAAVDQSPITGESIPVLRGPDETVYAGTIATDAALVIRVGSPAGETMLDRIIRLVEEARERRAPAQEFIDRFAHPYTIGVLVVTAAAVVMPQLLWDEAARDAWYRAMTLLVVASPCALVISTPAAILSAIANGARHGVLFKGGAHLELAGSVDTVAFDKTGTLTTGHPTLQAGADPQGRPTDAGAVLATAAAVEQGAGHPLARGIVAAARAAGLAVPAADSFRSSAGIGAEAEIAGCVHWVGNEVMAERQGAVVPPGLLAWREREIGRGRTVVLVGSRRRVLGGLALADAIRPGAAAVLRHLKYEGIRRIVVLTGDDPGIAAAVAAEVGADEVRAGLLPEQKVEAVRNLVATARGVAMVGDGINDAPAMAEATLGIAMGKGGTDVAVETAGVILMADDLERVDYAIHLGKRTRRIVRQNVVFSVGWMAFLVVLAVAVGLPLPLAVLGHEGSTLLVAANGLRLLGGAPHPPAVPAGWTRPAAAAAPAAA
jgi:Zn2+/Cd2+-exporting ATPase